MDDLISRQDVLRHSFIAYRKDFPFSTIEVVAVDTVKELMSIEEFPGISGWQKIPVVAMPYNTALQCKKCFAWGQILTFKKNFCPNCGARMAESDGEK